MIRDYLLRIEMMWKKSLIKYLSALLIGAAIPSYYLWKETQKEPTIVKEVVVEEKVVVVEKEVVKWKTKDRIVEKIVTQPDGTKIETKIQENTQTRTKLDMNIESTTQSQSHVMQQLGPTTLTRFGLGVMIEPLDFIDKTHNFITGLGIISLTKNIDLVGSGRIDLRNPSWPTIGLGIVIRF